MIDTLISRLPRAALALVLATGAVAGVRADDNLQWLEEPHGSEALAWARKATQQTREKLGASPSRATLAKELGAVLNQAPAEPDQYLLGKRIVRFLRDAAHPYGLLQTAPAAGAGQTATWTTVLDVAQLREREGIAFELQAYSFGSSCVAPDYTRCLLRLSPGGGDEAEIREFDLGKAAFVENGFRIGKSRAFAEWMGPDTVMVAHTLGNASKTLAGWPATVGLGARGQPISAATPVFQAEASDAIVQLSTAGSGARTRGVITRAIDYSTFEIHLVDAHGKARLLPFPQALKSFGVQGASSRHIVVQLAKDAVIEGKPYAAETVVAYDMADGVADGQRVSAVYTPASGEFVDAATGGLAANRDEVLLIVNEHLVQRVVGARPAPTGWTHRDVMQIAPGDTVTLRADQRDSDDFVASIAGFVTPRSQYRVRADGSRQLLAQDPSMIDGSRFKVEIGSADSKDGTSIDYFLLRPVAGGAEPYPLLMTGYAAFGISMRPGYFDGFVGGPAMKLWLDRGGAVAIPAARGGGERGSAWHMAAIRDKRQTSYDDFIAVIEHLIKTGVTRQDRLGNFGLSNGGLLTATLGTQRPDLFGAVVSDVPLTDLIRMRHMGMGAAWMNEYGNPDEPAQATAMLAYSPYQNVRKGTTYPPFLVTISTEDNRVGPGHARKFAHRLRDAGATTYFYEDEEGGHGVSDALRNPELMALRMSFLIDTLMTSK